jgi:NhaP-type Na+/H+ or K+/H+ antiporter
MLSLLLISDEQSEEYSDGEEVEEFYIETNYIVLLALIIIYTMTGSYIEHIRFSYIHETGVAIILGMGISLIASLFGYSEFNYAFKFSENLFFFVLLPPIVFAAGYNMKRKKFFKHFSYIALFGVVGTFVCFVSFTTLTGLLFYIQPLTKYIPATGMTEEFTLTTKEILLFCSCMSSSDIIAALSIVSFEKTPKLYSIVLGEGILNDAAAIILFNTVFKYTKPDEKFTTETVFTVGIEFVKLSFSSIAWGFISAFS